MVKFIGGLSVAVILVTLARLYVAAHTGLSPDEAYYALWSHVPQAGYPDHPPMVAAWIAAGRAWLGDTSLGVRFLSPLAAALASLMLGAALADRRAAIAAMLLLNATLAVNAGAVTLTPDTPLLFFWAAALAALLRVAQGGHENWWLAVGTAMGLAGVSKYSAGLCGGGIVLWLLICPPMRAQFRRWQLYAGGAIAAALFAPVIMWNAAHAWVSFARQGGRVADFTLTRAPGFVTEAILSQCLLMTPGIAVVFVAGMIWAVRRGRDDRVAMLLACTTLLPAAVFIEHALGDRVQANWPTICYPGLAIAAGLAWPRGWRAATVLGAVLSVLVLVQITFTPLSLPRVAPLSRLADWPGFAAVVDKSAQAAKADFIASDEYGLAAELAFYQTLPTITADPRWDNFTLPHPPLAGHTGLLLISAHRAARPDPSWGTAQELAPITRAGEAYTVYAVTPRVMPAHAVLLPKTAPSR